MDHAHTQILAEAGDAFGAAFDPVAAPWNVVRFFVPRLADWAVIALFDSDRVLNRVAHAHVAPAAAARLADCDNLYPRAQSRPASDAIGRVLRSGRPFIVADVEQRPDLMPAALAVDQHGTRALLVVPLEPRRHVPGVIVLGAETPGRFGHSEARLAAALALRAGVVLEIARRCDAMRAQDAPSARARRRAELTRQLIGR